MQTPTDSEQTSTESENTSREISIENQISDMTRSIAKQTCSSEKTSRDVYSIFLLTKKSWKTSREFFSENTHKKSIAKLTFALTRRLLWKFFRWRRLREKYFSLKISGKIQRSFFDPVKFMFS